MLSTMRVAIYIRVSTEEQAREGLSLEAQENRLVTFANRQDMTVVDIYRDAGFSARKNPYKRPEFARLLKDVEAEKFDLILFIKLDRWFRSVADYYKVQEILDKHNVAWMTTEEDYDTTTTGGRLNLNIRLAIAQDEADRTSDRIKFVFDRKIANGEALGGGIPLGYKVVDKKMVVDEETAPILRDIFDFYETVQSLTRTIEKIRLVHGYESSYSNTRRILKNEVYLGKRRDNHNYCDPLITQEQFDRVQKLLKRVYFGKKGASGQTYIFSGLLRCSECGKLMSASCSKFMKKDGLRVYNYYRCPTAHHGHNCKQSFKPREDLLEEYLLQRINSILIKEIRSIEKAIPKQTVKSNKDPIMRKIGRLKDLYVEGEVSLDEFRKKRDQLLDQIILPIDDTAKIERLETLKEALLSNIQDSYEKLNRESQQAFWRGLIDHIEIVSESEYRIFFV